jgi:hypothetical protein
MTQHERTGWRDEEISRRHRQWGYSLPAVDLDFVLIEYSRREPVALIEYKHERARSIDLSHANYEAVRRLANNYRPVSLPFFVAMYWTPFFAVRLLPMNETATAFCQRMYEFDGESAMLTEQRYVRALYRLRKIRPDDDLILGLNDWLPS